LQAEISELKEELNNMRHQNEQYCKNIKTMETQLMNEDNGNIRIITSNFVFLLLKCRI
jgi:hypothetical protein